MNAPGLEPRVAQEGFQAPEYSPATVPRQVVVLPTLADARARLVDLIRQRPAPAPRCWTTADDARVARRGRRAGAKRVLAMLDPRVDRPIASALRVSLTSVRRWRAGTQTPRPRHWRQLMGLKATILWGRP